MSRRTFSSAFTLLEVLVSVSVLTLMMTIIAELMMRTQDTITRASSHAREFQEARRALESISSSLSQATMDAILAYQRDPGNSTSIVGWERASDHHFILGPASNLVSVDAGAGQAVFFQAPLGSSQDSSLRLLNNLVNCCGFYVQYNNDVDGRPGFLQDASAIALNPKRKRFRLMQYTQSAEKSILYAPEIGVPGKNYLGLNKLTDKKKALRWFQDDMATASRPLAENVLALILVPHAVKVTSGSIETDAAGYSIAPDPAYQYDSRDFQWNGLTDANKSRRHQLPAMVTVTLIVADERSYDALISRLGDGDAAQEAAAEEVRNVFKDKFTSYEDYKADMASVESSLASLSLHYKVLSTSVSPRSSK
ncbi:MAG: Verru_Chthon cassette protein C [Verrucomicrobium sp.]